MLILAFMVMAQAPQVAFMDSEREIKLWLDRPVLPTEVPNHFSVVVDGKSIVPIKIRTTGEPVVERSLPRTKGRVILAGTLQAALGAKAWDPDGEITQMSEVSSGVFEFVASVNKGRYEYKVTRDGSWEENYGKDFLPGGSNLILNVPSACIVKFVVNFNDRTIKNSVDNPAEILAPTEWASPAKSRPKRFHTVVLECGQSLPVNRDITVTDPTGLRRTVIARQVLDLPQYRYEGNDLGSRWTAKQTDFRVWSPVSHSAEVVFASGKTVKMSPGPKGTWHASVLGNLHGAYYQYRFKSYGEARLTQDIYCRSASPDSKWSMVVDLSKTNPTSWPTPTKLYHRSQTDAILYELSVRDFTSLASSGVPFAKRGTYAGLVQAGTVVPGTHFRTGFDYLRDLGVTDIHLLPTQNFLNGKKGDYSWGYATNLFNVPEETYSTQPSKPVEVIREFKQMVQGIHRGGMRVVMDVVYNHTWPPQGKDSAFWQTVPYYYVRTNDRGDVLNESGVGNALADEHLMARKYVRDSLLYWAKEYLVDGFRFDLLGLHNRESVQDWAHALRAIRKDLVLYGEPWTGGGPNRFPKGTQRGTTFAVFNDDFRNAFRGDLDGETGGFVMGAGGDYGQLANLVRGSCGPDGFADSPQQTINYLSAHDNLTLLDRVAKSVRPDLQRSALRLAGASILLSQGVPFLEGGVEIGRTKGGNGNSYDAGDAVNGYDWRRAMEFTDVHAAYKELIRLRRTNSGFRFSTAGAVGKGVQMLPRSETPPNMMAFVISSGNKRTFVVLHGGLAESVLPANSLYSRPTKLAPLSYSVVELPRRR